MDGQAKNSLVEAWQKYTNWLRQNYPRQYEGLNGPATENDFKLFKDTTGYDFPYDLKTIYSINNGGVSTSLWSYLLMSIEDIIEEYKVIQEINGEGAGVLILPEMEYSGTSNPEGAIKTAPYNEQWVPFLDDSGGNFIGLDLDPGQNGKFGQIINFGRDEYRQSVIAESLEAFIDLALKQAESGDAEEYDNYESPELQDLLIKNSRTSTDSRHLDIVEYGKQTTKIFFIPHIKVFASGGAHEISADWAGRIMPGQSLFEGVKLELEEVYGYNGRLEIGDVTFLDIAKDNQGTDIQRYDLNIKLFPDNNDRLPQ